MPYDSTFLGVDVPLPRFSPHLEPHVLRQAELRNGIYADYTHHTIVMHKTYRTCIFAALNVDRKQSKDTIRKDDWRIDNDVGAANQLDNAYYENNPYDRGHMAQRKPAAWGDDAQAADDDTFYYTNACMQHKHLNQDEWSHLEQWVMKHGNVAKYTDITGPIFGEEMTAYQPALPNYAPAFVPNGFFKVMIFVDDNNELQVRAFIIPQDHVTTFGRIGRRAFRYQKYQVTIKMIEEMTGLKFPNNVANRNPLYYHHTPQLEANLHISSFPESRTVHTEEDIVHRADEIRTEYMRDIGVHIAAAMVNPCGRVERGNEWISIINLSIHSVDIAGWRLMDDQNRELVLAGDLPAGESRRIGPPIIPLMLPNNRKSFIRLVDENNRLVDRVAYTVTEARVEGRAIVFSP